MFLMPGSRAKIRNFNTRKLLNVIIVKNSPTLFDLSSLQTGFSEFEVSIESLISVTNNVTLEFQFHSAGVFQSASYDGAMMTIGSGGTTIANPTTFIQLSQAGSVLNAGSGFNGWLRIYPPAVASFVRAIMGQSAHPNGTLQVTNVIGGRWTAAVVPVDGFQILCSAGNISSGTVKVYGLG